MVIKSEDEIRQLKVKASEQIAVTLEMYNKQYRGHYDSRLQKVGSVSYVVACVKWLCMRVNNRLPVYIAISQEKSRSKRAIDTGHETASSKGSTRI